MKKIIAIIILTCLFYACPIDRRYPLFFRNNSDSGIGLYFVTGGMNETFFPDTLLPISNEYLIKNLGPKERYIYDSDIPWNDIYKRFPLDTMSIFVFHADTLAKYSWEQIREDYNILARYDLSYEDLKNRNMKLTYPWNTQY